MTRRTTRALSAAGALRAAAIAAAPLRAEPTAAAPAPPIVLSIWLSDKVTSKWTAERIFDELQERGYVGGRTVVKEYVRCASPAPGTDG